MASVYRGSTSRRSVPRLRAATNPHEALPELKLKRPLHLINSTALEFASCGFFVSEPLSGRIESTNILTRNQVEFAHNSDVIPFERFTARLLFRFAVCHQFDFIATMTENWITEQAI